MLQTNGDFKIVFLSVYTSYIERDIFLVDYTSHVDINNKLTGRLQIIYRRLLKIRYYFYYDKYILLHIFGVGG